VHRHRHKFRLRTGVGEVEIQTWHGQDSVDGHWGCPLRERWQLSAHQKLSPWWMEKVAFTVTVAGSYEGAARLLEKLGHRADDTTLHALAQRLGARAQAQARERLQKPLPPPPANLAASELAVIELDGWQVRERGPGWGKKKTQESRVEWHELKTGVFYLQEHSARKGERGLLSQKTVVSWQGEAVELGRRLHPEACARGLALARERLIVSDGAPWIWNLARARWSGAVELLDFYHASEHLWDLGEAVVGSREGARRWVEKKLHQLRHGRQGQALREVAALEARRGARGKVIVREKNYFAQHARRMNYQAVARRGWPIGSGAVESACRQRQGRFKRCGQFWTPLGLSNLCALSDALQNGHWDELWN
jgi:hypothetical protein